MDPSPFLLKRKSFFKYCTGDTNANKTAVSYKKFIEKFREQNNKICRYHRNNDLYNKLVQEKTALQKQHSIVKLKKNLYPKGTQLNLVCKTKLSEIRHRKSSFFLITGKQLGNLLVPTN